MKPELFNNPELENFFNWCLSAPPPHTISRGILEDLLGYNKPGHTPLNELMRLEIEIRTFIASLKKHGCIYRLNPITFDWDRDK